MALADDLSKKIKNKEDLAFVLSYAANNMLKNKTELKGMVDSDIEKCRAFLAKNKFHSTVNHERREHTKKLEYFMQLKKIVGGL